MLQVWLSKMTQTKQQKLENGTYLLAKNEDKFIVRLKKGQTIRVSIRPEIQLGFMYLKIYSSKKVTCSTGPVSYGMIGKAEITSEKEAVYSIRVSGSEGLYEFKYEITDADSDTY